ncbi:MAG: TetR/AcrR family transcriptional regulator [Actinoplanes sp.]
MSDRTTTPVGADSTRTQSKRSIERRAKLVEGAHRVFERDGFIDARITDIAKEVGLAHGSFYTYFSSKEEIFRVVAEEIQAEMFDRHRSGSADLTPYQRIEAANRRYLESYRRHSRIMAIIEQVSTFNEEIRSIRESRAQETTGRTERSIRRLQAEGLADPELDPHLTAVALTSMLSRFAYLWMGADTGPAYKFDIDAAVDGLTRLWANAIGLKRV